MPIIQSRQSTRVTALSSDIEALLRALPFLASYLLGMTDEALINFGHAINS